MINMKYLKMNKTIKIYIVIAACSLANSYGLAGDLLDDFIGEFIVKADFGNDKMSGLIDVKQGKAEESNVKAQQEATADKKISENTQDLTFKSNDTVQQEVKSEIVNDAKTNKTKVLLKELKDSSIMSFRQNGPSAINDQLENVMAQLKSLRFSNLPESENIDSEIDIKVPSEAVIAKMQLEGDPNNGSTEKIENQKPLQNAQLIVIIPEGAEGVVDSFELAESLFYIEDKVAALKFYRRALGVSLPTGTKENPRRAWIIFQIGNCLYNENGLEAIKSYEQLITEHPSSDWTNCARTKMQVLKWLVAEKPMALTMSEVK